MLSSQVLAMIRNTTALFLSESCTIEREGDAIGVYGDRSSAWVVTASDVDCRLIQIGQRTGSAVSEAAAAETMQDEYQLIVARSVSLDVDYRVTVGGVVYYVVRLEDSLTDEAFHSAIVQRRR